MNGTAIPNARTRFNDVALDAFVRAEPFLGFICATAVVCAAVHVAIEASW